MNSNTNSTRFSNNLSRRKIVVRVAVTAICIAALGLVFSLSFNLYKSRPLLQNELWGIAIGDSWQDVRFKKGMPSETRGQGPNDNYLYYLGDCVAWVKFKDGKVMAIFLLSTRKPDFELQGIRFGDSTEKITDKFGSDGLVKTSSDGLNRNYIFKKYQVVFGLSKDVVEVMGVFNNAFDVPLQFTADTEEDDKSGPTTTR